MNKNNRGHLFVFLFLLTMILFVIIGGLIDFSDGRV